MDLVELHPDSSLWNGFFQVAPLVVVGTQEPAGQYDFAPKHMAMPLGWGPHFGFVCCPRHRTYANAAREGGFTVTYLKPDQVLLASLAASPHCDDGPKPELSALPSFPAARVKGAFLKGGYLYLECALRRIVDGFGENSLIAGEVVAARMDPTYQRQDDCDDNELLQRRPLLAYLPPGRWASVHITYSFPFPNTFSR